MKPSTMKPLKQSSAAASDRGRARPPAPNATDPYHAAYEATLEAITRVATKLDPSWDVARVALRPSLEAAGLPALAADQFEVRAKQLCVLIQLHPKMEPETSFAKLQEIIAAMERECSSQDHTAETLFHGLRDYFVHNVIKHGALQRTIQGGFTVSVEDVPSLLDRYRWVHDADRTHMHRLLRISLEAVADFRSGVEAVERLELEDADELRRRLSHASAKLLQTVSAAAVNHDAQLVADPGVESVPAKVMAMAMARSEQALKRLLPRRSDVEPAVTAEGRSAVALPSMATLSIADAPNLANVTLAGRYTLGAIVTTGAFATLYRATDGQASAAVTVKVSHGPDAILLTRRECHFLRTLTSTGGAAHGIVRYVDGAHAPPPPARPFCVTEGLGPSVFETFVSRDAPPQRCTTLELTSMAEQMLRALAFLESRSVLHGHLTPMAIRYAAASSAEKPSFRMTDFGHAVGECDGYEPTQQAVSYRAPESILLLPCSYPTEIFSLGVTLCEVSLHQGLADQMLGGGEASILGMQQALLGMQPPELLAAPHAHRYFDQRGQLFEFDESGAAYLIVPQPTPLRPMLTASIPTSAAATALTDLIMLMLDHLASNRPTARVCLQRLAPAIPCAAELS